MGFCNARELSISAARLNLNDYFWPEAEVRLVIHSTDATDPKQPVEIIGYSNLFSDISNAYRFQGRLKRLPFALSFLGLSVVVGLVSWNLRQSWLAEGVSGSTYASVAWGTEVLVALLVLPLCAARLRDLEWPSLLAVFIFVSPALSPTLLVLIALKNGGSLSAPHWMPGLILISSVVLVVGIVILLVMRGTDGDVQI